MPGRRAAALQGTAQRDQGVRVDPAGTGRGLRSQPAEAGPTGRQDPVVDGLSRDAQHISQQIPQRHGAVRHAPQQRRHVPQHRDVQRHGAAQGETAQQAAHGAQDTCIEAIGHEEHRQRHGRRHQQHHALDAQRQRTRPVLGGEDLLGTLLHRFLLEVGHSGGKPGKVSDHPSTCEQRRGSRWAHNKACSCARGQESTGDHQGANVVVHPFIGSHLRALHSHL
mmetsp:Transcript_42750/g.92965  ORF Transcript_42750/g.92965 Transcript_42750/m.92965 type:complete len:223 (+) Transcript_42750:1059-1727(+)